MAMIITVKFSVVILHASSAIILIEGFLRRLPVQNPLAFCLLHADKWPFKHFFSIVEYAGLRVRCFL